MVIPGNNRFELNQVVILVGLFLSIQFILSIPILAQQSQQERISALCDSGYVMLELQDNEKARNLFRDVLDLDRNHPEALLGMGRALLGPPQRTSRALDYLRRALVQTPENLEVHYYKAFAHTYLAINGFISRDNGRSALEEIETVLSLNPSHADAYYLRGQVLRDVFQDYEEAIEAFRSQVEVNPNHSEATVECIKTAVDAGDWEYAIEAGERLITRDTGVWEALPYLAAAYWKADMLDEAMDTFNRFFAQTPEQERDIYFDLSYLLTPDEAEEFNRLDSSGQTVFWNQYWRARNPNPKSIVNERLLEHFIRVAYARAEFSKEKWPWDTRGNFYVRYGEPDIKIGPNQPYPIALIDDWDFFVKYLKICNELGLQRPMYMPGWLEGRYAEFGLHDFVDGSGTSVGWLYLDKGVDIQFANPVMNGVFQTMSSYGPLVEAMGRRMPVISAEEEKIETFDPLQSAVTFRGEDGKTEMEYAIGLLPDHIGAFRSITGEYNFVEANIDLFTPEWTPVGEVSEQFRNIAARPQFSIRGNPVLVHNATLSADPGEYLVSILVMEPETGIRATVREEVSFPDYSGDDLMMSDILPAARITEVGSTRTGRFIRGDLEVIPLPGRMIGKDQPLFIYFEIYNLTRDRFGGTQYRIEYSVSESKSDDGSIRRLFQGIGALVGISGRPAVLSSEFSREGIQKDVRSHLEIDMSALPHDVYDLIVTITDRVTGHMATSVLTFRTLPILPN